MAGTMLTKKTSDEMIAMWRANDQSFAEHGDDHPVPVHVVHDVCGVAWTVYVVYDDGTMYHFTPHVAHGSDKEELMFRALRESATGGIDPSTLLDDGECQGEEG